MKLLGIISTNFDVIINYCSDILHSSRVEKKWEYNGAVHELFIDFERAYSSVRREVLYSSLTEFGIPMKLSGRSKNVRKQWNGTHQLLVYYACLLHGVGYSLKR
jgi:hypothetical protein